MHKIMALTLIYLATILIFGFYLEDKKSLTTMYEYDGNDEGRNERSSPRSFILPATPAIALEQERKVLLRKKETQIKYCMLKLYDLGYTVGSFRDIFNINIFISTLSYQKERGIRATGNFDDETIKSLGCKV